MNPPATRPSGGLLLVVAVAVAAMALGGVAPAGASAGMPPPPDADEHVQPLPGAESDQPTELRGEAAVAHLEATGDIDAVAANASMTGAALVEELEADPLMFVTGDGMVGYTEPALFGPPYIDDGGPTEAATDVDVFALHSRPETGLVVFLDFTGHATTGDYWNGSYDIDPIVSAPYDIDGDTGSYSDAERQRIHDVWAAVADDFAPFDVDVTTEDPGSSGLRRTSASDMTYGSRIVITSSDWYYDAKGKRIGGIALIDVFSSSVDHSAFVFSGNLGGGSVKAVSEAASHEAGHTFGLLHDGKGTSTYYSGHGDWAPIMGVGYSKTITQWSKGEYSGATNHEHDLQVMQDHVFVAPDDHGDVAAEATAVSATSTTSGVIAVDDLDVFSVEVGAGLLSATVSPTGKNLHAVVRIRSAEGTLLASASPTSALEFQATASATVPAGTYVIEIAPTGWLTASTGFTAYASLGAYELAVTGTAPDSPPSPPPSTPPSTPPEPPSAGKPTSGFVALTPRRIVDTRVGLGGSDRLAAGELVSVQVAGEHGIAADATAAVVNVTAVAPASSGFLSVFPCSTGSPDTSVLNYGPGEVVANSTIATLDGSGRLCVWTLAASDVLVDITGWLAPGAGARLSPIGPLRVADTRSGLGGSGRLGAGGTLRLDLGPQVGAEATAVALNITAVDAATGGFLTAYPCGGAPPDTSTVNHGPGEIRPNNTIVGLGDGSVCVFSLAPTDVVVDLVGAFGPSGLGYAPADPHRLLDTRELGPALGAGGVVEYALGTSVTGTPAAASVNVTAVGHQLPGFTTTYACGAPPDTSTLNQVVGAIAANGAIVPATSTATSCAFTLNGGHLIVDLAGWWV